MLRLYLFLFRPYRLFLLLFQVKSQDLSEDIFLAAQWGAICSTIGLMLGSSLAFGIARGLGIKFVEKIVKKEYINKFNFFITHKGLYICLYPFSHSRFPQGFTLLFAWPDTYAVSRFFSHESYWTSARYVNAHVAGKRGEK